MLVFHRQLLFFFVLNFISVLSSNIPRTCCLLVAVLYAVCFRRSLLRRSLKVLWLWKRKNFSLSSWVLSFERGRSMRIAICILQKNLLERRTKSRDRKPFMVPPITYIALLRGKLVGCWVVTPFFSFKNADWPTISPLDPFSNIGVILTTF